MAELENTGTDIMGIVSRLMSDPSVMAAVSGAVNGAKSEGNETEKARPEEHREDKMTDESPKNSEASPSFDLAALSSLLSGAGLAPQRGDRHDDADERKKRCALLAALKPYLNPHRRETIDNMLSIERLGDALRTVKKS